MTPPPPSNNQAATKADAQRARNKAHTVLKSLSDVLYEAQLRGVDLRASFLHFDRTHEGLVGTQDFMTAIAELRLVSVATAWTEEDAQECIYWISFEKSRTYFKREDFIEFFTQLAAQRHDKKAVSNQHHTTATAVDTHVPQSPTRNNGDVNDDAGDENAMLSARSWLSPKSRARAHEKRKRPRVTLPDWAHDRSKRALRELENLHKQRQCGIITLTSIPQHLRVAKSGDESSESTQSPPLSARSKNDDAALRIPLAAAPEQQLLEFPIDPRWKSFDVDDTTRISYAILTHDATASPRAPSQHSPFTDPSAAERERVQTQPFRFTVFLDAFQRLETLEAFFVPFLTHFPRGKVLLCGFPTRLRATTILNNAFLAACYAKLLLYLQDTTKEWLAQPKLGIGAVPQYVLAFGSGASVAIQLVASEVPLHATRLEIWVRALRGLVLVNAYMHGRDDVFRSTLRTLRRVLRAGHVDATQLHEALVGTLFSDYYLTQVAASRQQAMTQFFQSRQHFMHLERLELLQRLVHGMAKSQDVGEQCVANLAALLQSPCAVLAVHGTHNALFTPTQVEWLVRPFEPVAPSVAASVSLMATTPQAHVSWLKGGHELLQERPRFFYDLLRQLVLVETIVKVDEEGNADETSTSPLLVTPATANRESSTRSSTNNGRRDSHSDDEESPPANQGSRSPTRQGAAKRTRPVRVSEHVRALAAKNGIKWIQQELYDRDLDGSGATDALLLRYQRALDDEAAQERAKRERRAKQEAKYAELDAKWRQKQQEENAQRLRENAVVLAIQRREDDAKRALYARMEDHKRELAQIAMDCELMAIEDALSGKYEDALMDEADRVAREALMARQVQELQAERDEQEREAYQLQLQQQRLAEQQAKREALKQFQRAFETDALLSSPIEAYHLDLTPEYDHFERLSSGARAIAKDLVHFYEIKVLQLEETAVKKQELDVLRKRVADRELALRNLERVLLKAKTTGTIAKAGLGTVRIVPITPAEFQGLLRDQDEKQNELARLQNELTLLSQDLSWKDQLLQRLSVLIKRNEGFRTEMLATMTTSLDKGNDQVLLLREDEEKWFEARHRSERVEKASRTRLEVVQAELAQAMAATTEYFDTLLRVDGTVQRVLRSIVVREHTNEISVLEKRLAQCEEEQQDLAAKLRLSHKWLNEVGTRTFVVEQSLRELEQAVMKAAPAAGDTANSSGAERGALGHLGHQSTDNSSSDPSQSLAERVRFKRHVDRTAEEKAWVVLDFMLHFAFYFKHVDAQEVEIIQRHADYATKPLTKPQLERVLTLPARNNLALAFFKSQAEVDAHYLLRKYTFEDGEDHVAQADARFVLPNHMPALVVQQLGEMPAAVTSVRNHNIPRSKRVLLDENVPPQVLLHEAQCQIQPHKSVTHTFRLPNPHSTGVLSLLVSIVFHGHFKSVGYQNGRLAGMLYVLPTNGANGGGSGTDNLRSPIAIGKCFSAVDIGLCTPHSMGKLVLRHEPRAWPVEPNAIYQLVLGAPVHTSYSVEVTAKTATFAGDVLRAKRVDALKKQELLPNKREEITNVFVTLQLSERKKRLARKMAFEAKDAARAAELELLKRTRALEHDNAVSELTPEERLQLHAAISDAEQRFTRLCFLYAKREEEVKDMEKSLRELTKLHADLLDECDAMERDLSSYRAHLPELASVLDEHGNGHAAGARMAKELHIEFTYTGDKSSKVLWAELSAMKAKLPSLMSPAERLRRKYKKGQEVMDKHERAWIILDRIQHPTMYDWEERLVVDGHPNARMRLHGAHPRLTKDEEQLAVMSKMEVDRIVQSPWNLLERREIQIRKAVTKFRDDGPGQQGKNKRPTAAHTVALLRATKPSDLTPDERAWRALDQVLNPSHYPVNLKTMADNFKAMPGGAAPTYELPAREDLIAALDTPEDELYKLPSELLRARNLLLRFDPTLSTNLTEAQRMQNAADTVYAKVEVDVDARCRVVYQELQRAIANTRNEFMDSAVLHTVPQRFPTKVLRLELEKELDRLLVAQVQEREEYELEHFLAGDPVRAKINGGTTTTPQSSIDPNVVSDSDSDEEARILRESKAAEELKQAKRDGKYARVRGRAVQQKTLMKQRREIKDALQGRSLEERRLLLEEQELGPGGCMACRTNPCSWKPFLEESAVTIQQRIDVLQEELERVRHCDDATMASTVCLTALKSGGAKPVVMRRGDLFDELTHELKSWDKNLRLKEVDREFHATFTTKDTLFETKALHGFAQVQLKHKVQMALQREHNLLVASLTASEVVDDILEFMLEGWCFGERESTRRVGGYVPSLKREGPLTMQDLRRFEQDQRILNAREELREEENVQGIPLDKWRPIEVAAFTVDKKTKAVKHGTEIDRVLTETENALRFGLFSMTLMYFRGLSLLKHQRSVWSMSTTKEKERKSDERVRMDRAAKNAALRTKRAALYDAKAHAAQQRNHKMHEQKVAAYRQSLVLQNQKAKREAHAAVEIQRMYRGHMGRKAGKKWMLRRREIDAQRALERAAAIMLQRAYRGRLGRIRAEEQRIELAEFISQIRAEEAIEEEEEYWRTHRLERIARRVSAFINKKA